MKMVSIAISLKMFSELSGMHHERSTRVSGLRGRVSLSHPRMDFFCAAQVAILLLATLFVQHGASETVYCDKPGHDKYTTSNAEGKDAECGKISWWIENYARKYGGQNIDLEYGKWTESNFCVNRIQANYFGRAEAFHYNREERLWYFKSCIKVEKEKKNCFAYEKLMKRPRQGVHRGQFGSVKLYPVKYKGEFLFGWLYFKWTPDRAQTPPARKETTMFLVQAETSDPSKTMFDDSPVPDATHGRFYHHLSQENAPAMGPSKADIAICLFPKDPALEVGTAFQAVYGTHGVNWEGVTLPAPKEISGFHQMNFPLCPVFGHEGLDTKLWFRAVHDHREQPSNSDAREYYEETPLTDALSLKYWVYGAADPKPPRGAKLEYDKNSPGDWPPWVEVEKSTFGVWMTNKTSPDQKLATEIFNHKKSDHCIFNDFGTGAWSTDPPTMDFKPYTYTRCNNRRPKTGPYSKGQHWCPNVKPWSKDLKPVNSVYDAIFKSSCAVSSPTSEGECKNYQNFFRKYGTSLSFGLGRFVWGARLSHGVFMAIAGLFVVPCVNFIARYFKETFLSHRFLHMHVWYFCHAFGGILAFFALAVGYLVAVQGRLYLGFPWDPAASIHALIGYVALLLLILTFVQTSFRIYPPTPRKVSIMVHAIGGYVIQALLVADICVSAFMQGSPTSISGPCSGSEDSPNCGNTKPDNLAGYITLAVVVLKIACEVGLHILMTGAAVTTDRLENVDRAVAPPVMIPVVLQNATSNRAGDDRRIFFLIIYVAINFVLAACLVIVLLSQDPKNRFAGATSVTHKRKNELRIDLKGLGDNE